MAKAIMIQGTMSNSGKSFIAAALCRIFMQDGYSAAPFKSQNMALNSYITEDGLEMGRAQAMQAEAAGIKPSVLMNPILLKPTSDVGSQVIINGRAIGNMRASEYFRRKREFIPQITEAYNSLAAQHDIIVIEGAGSPVELNLKSEDIVNMGMARLADAPVLLTGDIDRGGVFAQLIGTLMLLEKEEQDRVKGLIVNKFRGDKSIFSDGVKILEEKGGKPVVGVVPYLRCDIDDEDSLSDKLERKTEGAVKIAVIRLPRLSNFTDFDVFSQYEGVSVQYVTAPSELEKADMIIIPGTKSTISDMLWMRSSGMEAAVKKRAAAGVMIFGICGGYQMLGESISDPLRTETDSTFPETIDGMGLLGGRTVFSGEKRTVQVSGRTGELSGGFAALSDMPVSGYEIHMGMTETDGTPLCRFSDGTPDGEIRGNVCGSYIHGIFDSPEMSGGIVDILCKGKGISVGHTAISRSEYKERQYDILAEGVRNNIDMKLIYNIIFGNG
ncbi:MAG: cobyric acid synthase [Huintestinicola sp.]